MSHIHKHTFLLLLAFSLATCNFPNTTPKPPEGINGMYTQAAQTLQAQKTLAANTLAPTITLPAIISTATPIAPTPNPAVTSPPPQPPTAIPTPDTCNRATFLTDVTIPDGSPFAPGEKFTKTWRIQNSGTCAWTTAYNLVYTTGERMDAPAVIPLPRTVQPNETIDLSVELTAPQTPGKYRSEWQLRTQTGILFGVGSQANQTFWASIEVVLPGGIAYDFLSQASQAEWRGNDGNQDDLPITFNGDQNNPNGAAAILESTTLENGRNSGRVLITIPAQARDGSISGTFPAYTVQSNDSLKVNLAFLAESDGSCGEGQVIFRIRARDGNNLRNLGEWHKQCDKRILNIQLNLSDLKSKTVQFIFMVETDGSPTGDRVVWASARIER